MSFLLKLPFLSLGRIAITLSDQGVETLLHIETFSHLPHAKSYYILCTVSLILEGNTSISYSPVRC